MRASTAETIEFFDPDGRPVGSITIYGGEQTLWILDDEEARQYGEERFQLVEGQVYDYSLATPSNKWSLQENSLIVPSRAAQGAGTLSTGSYTGALQLELRNIETDVKAFARVEVRSAKIGYRDDYRQMLEDIADVATELVMSVRSPAQTRVAPDPGRDARTLQQRFEFLKSIVYTREFREALQRVTSAPHRLLEDREEIQDIRRGGKLGRKGIKQIASSGQKRWRVPAEHPLYASMKSLGVDQPSVPAQITRARKHDTVDTAENRFVKYTLALYTNFLEKMKARLGRIETASDQRLYESIEYLQQYLGNHLRHSFFRDISELRTLPLGSPVLQKRAGYREILRAWVKFSIAASLTWTGGDDVYGAGSRNVAALYEYWVFFALLKVVCSVFEIPTPELANLLEVRKDGFGIGLKRGKPIDIRGQYLQGQRKLNIAFSYNRTFPFTSAYSKPGTWTRAMRPDYTLTLWPAEFSDSQEDAEAQELLVHIHFDAKYKLDSLREAFGDSINQNVESVVEEEKQGTYRRGDLLKMHAYHDAIRRTEGAYILYPGNQTENLPLYEEILPSLGAFIFRPQGSGSPIGESEIAEFIRGVARHVCNRLSLIERLGYHRYEALKSHKEPLDSAFPEKEFSSATRAIPLSEHYVLVIPVPNTERAKYILGHQRYALIPPASGKVTPALASARHLLFVVEESGEGIGSLCRVLETPELQVLSQANPTAFTGDETQKEIAALVYRFSPDERFSDMHFNLSGIGLTEAQVWTVEELLKAGADLTT